MASPWLFGFTDVVYLPHLLLGLFAVVASLLTETKPLSKRPPYHQHDDMHAHPADMSEEEARPPYPEA